MLFAKHKLSANSMLHPPQTGRSNFIIRNRVILSVQIRARCCQTSFHRDCIWTQCTEGSLRIEPEWHKQESTRWYDMTAFRLPWSAQHEAPTPVCTWYQCDDIYNCPLEAWFSFSSSGIVDSFFEFYKSKNCMAQSPFWDWENLRKQSAHKLFFVQ